MAPVAVVAGGSRGLGLLICRQLAEAGYDVHTCARDAVELDRAREVVASYGHRLQTAVCDVRDADAVRGWIESIGATPDVAIHVAGVIQVVPAREATTQMYRDAIDTMLLGPIYLVQSVIGGMLERGSGRIGVVSSVGGVVSAPRLVPYSVAKFGAVGLGEGLAAELAGTGVTCTTIVPGLMRTGSHGRARFLQAGSADFAWFATAASLPLLSIDADRAAERIVAGVLAGRPRVELTPLTWVAQRVHGLAPSLTVRMTGLVSRLLPTTERGDEQGTDDMAEGRELPPSPGSRLTRPLRVLGERAAARNNER